jgi:ABC-type phosphate transport system substrate-binding protein
MTAVKQSMGKLGVFVGLVAMFAAIAAMSAASASASFTTSPCAGENIEGEGSSLQFTAQTIWGEGGNQFDVNSLGCPSGPKVKYNKTSSLPALEAWGVGTHTFKAADDYIASDEAPSGSAMTGQIKDMVEASGSPILTIPVTQAAIGVIIHLPANCSATEPQITNAALEQAFSGSGASAAAGVTWEDLGANFTGTGCSEEITRVVRNDGSGTTYQFKHYLDKIRKGIGLGNLSCIGVTWAELQEEVTKNKEWPESCRVGMTGTKLSPVLRSEMNGNGGANTGSGGGDEVKTVNLHPGTIGYAALADIKGSPSANTILLEVQNNGVEVEGAEFATSETSSGENSNCAKAAYPGAPEAVANADWSEVYGENPNSAGTNKNLYPICTLTWDVALKEYSKTSILEPKARTVSDFLKYVVASAGGQADATGKWYAALPTTIQSKAATLAGLINY